VLAFAYTISDMLGSVEPAEHIPTNNKIYTSHTVKSARSEFPGTLSKNDQEWEIPILYEY